MGDPDPNRRHTIRITVALVARQFGAKVMPN